MRNVFTALASTALTASGATAGERLPDGVTQVTAFVIVTAVSGTTPSATFTVQFSPDGTNWAAGVAGTAITATGSQRIPVPANVGEFVRVSYAITGTTPSFTTSIVLDSRG